MSVNDIQTNERINNDWQIFWCCNRDKSMFDHWSIVHMLGGGLIGAIGFDFLPFLIIHTAHEVIENNKMVYSKIPDYNGDSLENVIGDTLSATIGYGIISTIRNSIKKSKETPKQSYVILFIIVLVLFLIVSGFLILFIDAKAYKKKKEERDKNVVETKQKI